MFDINKVKDYFYNAQDAETHASRVYWTEEFLKEYWEMNDNDETYIALYDAYVYVSGPLANCIPHIDNVFGFCAAANGMRNCYLIGEHNGKLFPNS